MGMFDTFEITQELECSCGHTWIPKHGVQSKHFDCTLEEYSIGDVIPGAENQYMEYDWCPKCLEKVDLIIVFHNEIYVGIFQSQDVIKYALNNFDLLDEYKKTKLSQRKLQAEMRLLTESIEKIIDFNIQPRSKHSKFSFLTRIRVTDYDPIKALQKLLKDYQQD